MRGHDSEEICILLFTKVGYVCFWCHASVVREGRFHREATLGQGETGKIFTAKQQHLAMPIAPRDISSMGWGASKRAMVTARLTSCCHIHHSSNSAWDHLTASLSRPEMNFSTSNKCPALSVPNVSEDQEHRIPLFHAPRDRLRFT